MRTKLKRILSTVLACVMLISLLPATALAATDPDVVYGTYGDSTWTRDNSITDGSITDANTGITLSKTATPTDTPNVFDITLTVQTSTTTTIVDPSAAATVLVIDLSNSMYYCAECGNSTQDSDDKYHHSKDCKKSTESTTIGYGTDSVTVGSAVKTEETRLYAAKAAAKDFLKSYAGDNEAATRQLAIVGFGTSARTFLSWCNVAGGEGKNSYDEAVTAINNLAIGFTNPDPNPNKWSTAYTDSGGTNLQAGLQLAANLSAMNAVSGMTKNVIALTDGIPTYCLSGTADTTSVDYLGIKKAVLYWTKDIDGSGSQGSEKNNTNATSAANKVKEKADLYTVCFGVSDQTCYYNGPTVGDFLKNSVASPETNDKIYAYDANNADDLYKAFKAITSTITSGLDGTGLFVTDPMAAGVTASDLSIDSGITSEDTSAGFTWTLSSPETKTEGNTTYYIYTLTYKATLDPTAIEGFDEDSYYPLNGKTTLTIPGNPNTVLDFPVPGVKGVLPIYTISWDTDGDGDVDDTTQVRYGETPTHADGSKPADAQYTYTFIGWDPKIIPAKEDATYTAQFSSTTNQYAYTIEYYYDGQIDSSKTESGTAAFGSQITTYTDKNITGYKLDKTEGLPLTISATAEDNVIKVYYAKDSFGYTVEYYYDGVIDSSKTESGTAEFGSQITTYTDKNITGYKLDKTEGLPLTISETAADNVIKVYYAKDSFGYTIEYYYDGVLDESKTETLSAQYQEVISTFPDKSGDNYVLEKVVPTSLTISNVEADNVIKVYYVTKDASVDVTKVVTSVTNPAGKPYDTTETAKVGDTITWTITVTNKGNVEQTLTLTDILSNGNSVTITNTSGDVTIPATITLGVDETLTYTATYTVQLSDSGKTLVNTAVLKDGDTPKNDSTAPGVKVDPALTITKAVDKTTASVGDKLTYTITVTNNTNVELKDIVVTDEMLGMTGNNVVTIASLDAGKAWTQDYTYTVQSSDAGKTLVNTAIASIGEQELGKDSSDGTNIRKPYIPPVKPSKPVLNTEDHVAYIIGYDDGTVKPNNNITRAEVATIFFRLLSDDSRAEFWSQTNSYSDVALTNWFNNAVSTLSNAGVITGYPDDTFKPNASITRAEFAAIAARFSDAEVTGTCSFTDVPADHWAASSIALAEELGWITGYEDGTFHPDQAITRAEAMTLINRVLERAVDEDHMLSDMVTWTDNQPSDWFYEAVQEATNSHEYTRTTTKVPNQSFCYENWVKILEAPDWAALENAWSTANGQ